MITAKDAKMIYEQNFIDESVIEVFEDESLYGFKTKYKYERNSVHGGAFVRKLDGSILYTSAPVAYRTLILMKPVCII